MLSRQVHHLSRLLDDLLDVSRIEQGCVALKRQRLDLREVIRSAVDMCGPELATHRRLVIDTPAEALPVDGDQVRLTQVVVNLLSNAQKFTDEDGHIQVEASRSGNGLRLVVRDDGIGIAPEMLQDIFDMFAQAETSRSGGLGIGLTLVRKLVAMHGGKVEARSAGRGQGTEIEVMLPLAAAVAADTRLADTPAMGASRSRSVLVIDDNKDAADSFAMVLNILGMQAYAAYGGAEGLDAVLRHAPEIIFLDICMPGIDGYEVARRIRADHACSIILVAVTGWGQDSDRRRVLQAGFDHCLVKPVQVAGLQSLLAEIAPPNG
jgi:CheY-like chemotaxis protein